jgi:hypothetical protein
MVETNGRNTWSNKMVETHGRKQVSNKLVEKWPTEMVEALVRRQRRQRRRRRRPGRQPEQGTREVALSESATPEKNPKFSGTARPQTSDLGQSRL